jgi:hypothetical protein
MAFEDLRSLAGQHSVSWPGMTGWCNGCRCRHTILR